MPDLEIPQQSSQSGNHAPIEPESSVPIWVVPVILLVIGVMTAIPVYRSLHRLVRRPTAQPQAAPVPVSGNFTLTPPAPVTPLQPAPELGDADEAAILALPVQQQAEELIERSIRHDVRAREVLEEHLKSFKGVVHETPRMKQLLDRAQYSRDLRVRNAYCAMMLAMDGWSEDGDALQLLIDRTKSETDSQKRAYDVWFLGMLGGRGVHTAQVHEVLLGYARNDPDAYVRQWATEGMRFLGTDEALDELFDIFVSDPSFTVRDRAGCNVSDCGNFMRKQRMRMFPKFLHIVEDPNANAQMRNWSFLAMQEITDVALPPNAKAWRQWYTQYGAQRLAQFEALPEWQVRGDE